MLLAALALCPVSCDKSADPGAGADPVDMLPMDNDISGFTRKGAPAVMTDAQSIYDAIDGAAEKYIELGFVEGVFQKYGNGSTDLDVAVFNQGTHANALSVVTEFYPSSPEVLLSGTETLIADHGLTAGYSVHYVKGLIYLRVDTREKNDFTLNMAKQFCLNIGSKIELE